MKLNKLKHILPSLIAATTSVLLATNANAAIGISVGDPIGDPTSISITPGSSFALTLRLSATAEQLIGVNYSLMAPGGGSGKFTLVSRNPSGSPFSFMTIDNVSNLPLTNSPTVDLGALLDNVGAPLQPGTQHLASYTIASDPAIAPGVYHIEIAPSPFGLDPAANQVAAAGSSYQVTVVPEPGSATLALGTLGVLATLRRFRKQNVAS